MVGIGEGNALQLNSGGSCGSIDVSYEELELTPIERARFEVTSVWQQRMLYLRSWYGDKSDRERAGLLASLLSGFSAACLAGTLIVYGGALRGNWVNVGLNLGGLVSGIVGARASGKLHKEVVKEDKLKGIEKEAEELRIRVLHGLAAPSWAQLIPGDQTSLSIVLCLKMFAIEALIEKVELGFSIERYIVRVINSAPTRNGDGVGVKEVAERNGDLKVALRTEKRPTVEAASNGIAIDVPLSEDRRGVASFVKYVVEPILAGVEYLPSHPCVPVGVGNFDGELRELDFADPSTPHWLIAGGSGSGKTEEVRNALLALCVRYEPLSDVMIYILNPKNEFPRPVFDYLPHVVENYTDMESAIEMVGYLVEEMDRRYEMIADYGDVYLFNTAIKGEAPELVLPIIFLIADEFTDAGDHSGLIAGLSKLSRKGRGAGIHIIGDTQRPAAGIGQTHADKEQFLQFRANLKARAMLAVSSKFESNIITGSEENDNGLYLTGKGDMYYYGGESNWERLQGLFFAELQEAIRSGSVEEIEKLKAALPIKGGWREVPLRRNGNNRPNVSAVAVESPAIGVPGLISGIPGKVKQVVESLVRVGGAASSDCDRLSSTSNGSSSNGSPASVSAEEMELVDSLTGSPLERGAELLDLYLRYRQAREENPPKSLTGFIKKSFVNSQGKPVEGGRSFDIKAADIRASIEANLEDWLKSLGDKSDEEVVNHIWGVRLTAKDNERYYSYLELVRGRRALMVEQSASDASSAVASVVEVDEYDPVIDGSSSPASEESDIDSEIDALLARLEDGRSAVFDVYHPPKL